MRSSSSIIIALAFLICLSFSLAQPQLCSNTDTFSANITYRKNLNLLLSSLPSHVADNGGFYNATIGQDLNKVYAQGLCRGDLDMAKCCNCMNTTSQEITKQCTNPKEDFKWGANATCILRYSNRNIFGIMKVAPSQWEPSLKNISSTDSEQFNQTLHNLMESLVIKASLGSSSLKFAVGNTSFNSSTNVYGLVQCTPDISQKDCRSCLGYAVGDIPRCCGGKEGGKVLRLSCIVWFELYKFYNTTWANSPSLPPIESIQTIPPAPGPISDNSSSTKTSKGVSIFIKLVSSLATLPNGQEFAVKRLSGNSKQAEVEFKNEMLLVAKLQHRCLVKLQGFCWEGRERILIYELLGNGSLDQYIFDPVKRAQLKWEMRYNIICGIARGILYLHEDSRLKIIHRDLKPSNILLDEEMNPKISDFGLAKLVVAGQSHKTYTCAGTFGYMAPEYISHGHYSVKSDVFSFGVIVLEIVSGKKKSWFCNSDDVELLLSFAWKNWIEGTASNLIDQILGKCSRNEIMKCIHIGLLCVQENVAARPTMASVVQMLNSHSSSLPTPAQPAFLFCSESSDIEQDLPLLEFDSGASESEQYRDRDKTVNFLVH
ncbi:hypothetical protein ACB098_02G087000 [Castanea mollissima]